MKPSLGSPRLSNSLDGDSSWPGRTGLTPPRLTVGYVLKSGADDDIVTACRAAMRGEPFLYPSAIGALIRDVIARSHEHSDELEVLSAHD